MDLICINYNNIINKPFLAKKKISNKNLLSKSPVKIGLTDKYKEKKTPAISH